MESAAHEPGRGEAANPARTPAPESNALAGEAELTKLDPNFVPAMRVEAMFFWVPALIGALIADGALQANEAPVPFGLVSAIVLVFALVFVIRLPARRYQARGYHMSADRLRVVRGILWHSDTIVPFGRVQHIDVNQGPVERFFDIATLTVHTAGTHNASVQLPGLKHETATSMREDIRARIKRDSL